MYYFVKFFSWIAFYFYFSKIEINGKENIPLDKTPVLFAPNHQAAFLDPILVGVYTKRPVHFLTRADVFNPVSNFFYKRLNMLPIYRMRDGIGNLVKNQGIFKKCIEILKANRNLLIFPEGNQEGDYYLRPLTKGFYRITKGAIDGGIRKVLIIPAGINYFNHDHSGHKLILNFGKPITISQSEVETNGYRAIRDALSKSIRDLMLIPDYTDDYPQKVKSINRNAENEPFGILRDLLDSKKYIEPPRTYSFLRVFRQIFTIPNLPIHLMTNYVLKHKMEDPLFESSLKVGLLALIIPLWEALSFLIAFLIGDFLLAFIAITVQLSCLYAYSIAGRYTRI